MKVLFNANWIGNHGIGRFAAEIIKRTPGLVEYGRNSFFSPVGILDCCVLTLRVIFSRALFFSPGFNAPLLGLTRYIFTVHDLNHIDLPYNSSYLKKMYYDFIIKRACRYGCKILTVSEYSRKRIIEWSNTSPDKVVNVGNGVDPSFNVWGQPFHTGFRYFLCVGNRKKHKNEAALIRAFSLTNLDPSIKLLFTGSSSDEHDELSEKLGLTDRIKYTGLVSDEQLAGLYRGAIGLLFPSLYEGFGLPVIEAMACGIPVLTSNTTSLPEVAGDAALLVNPESIDEIRIGIERLATDQALREDLISKGLERAKLFSWDAVAARVQAVLDEVTSQHGK
ncbi:glycosyltransferase family 4 protein [Pseudaeromonas sharmana]|uniref:Glycosyltransferase family 4 protein n=1 Tax=Pseudaeromonas sharmana TaxID=328412 RepID=A0ABV8CS95_9GAMM